MSSGILTYIKDIKELVHLHFNYTCAHITQPSSAGSAGSCVLASMKCFLTQGHSRYFTTIISSRKSSQCSSQRRFQQNFFIKSLKTHVYQSIESDTDHTENVLSLDESIFTTLFHWPRLPRPTLDLFTNLRTICTESSY